jgi:hypothetical protein
MLWNRLQTPDCAICVTNAWNDLCSRFLTEGRSPGCFRGLRISVSGFAWVPGG